MQAQSPARRFKVAYCALLSPHSLELTQGTTGTDEDSPGPASVIEPTGCVKILARLARL